MSGKQCITHLSEGPPRARTLTEITNQTWGQRGALLFFFFSFLSLFPSLYFSLVVAVCSPPGNFCFGFSALFVFFLCVFFFFCV